MSVTIEIPGGQATFRELLDTERQRRPLKLAAAAAASAIAKLPDDDAEGSVRDRLAALPLSVAEAQSLMDLYDATIVAYLQSWTLDRPLPDTDGLLDLPPDLYDALVEAASKLKAPSETDFDPTNPRAPGADSTPTPASVG